MNFLKQNPYLTYFFVPNDDRNYFIAYYLPNMNFGGIIESWNHKFKPVILIFNEA